MDRVSALNVSGNKVRVTFESGRVYTLRKKDLLDFPLRENDPVDEKAFHQFVLLHQYPDALNAAVEMLARRACSRKEIADKLAARGCCEEVSSLVLYKLEKENLLNDQDFSEQWTRYRSGGNYGPAKIYRELRMKGVDEETAREAVSSVDDEGQAQRAFDLACKAARKCKPGEDPRKSRQRVLRALVSRGFDWDVAREAVGKAFSSDDE